ncbi:hypothetical protein F5144DRAFT_642161 [Chaetomium tenue]|uniref:Uncharacterized protein n=1 Tax=Chaetomium tenue TaxID=1854479 RepID=A0ACB7PH15_9PEZI|nr:hypothetical protein F5144DRAFT_642161 [Chaetomium globosum]
MIFIVLFLGLFLQGVFCGPLSEQFNTGCFVMQMAPVVDDCRQVINAFNRCDPTGYITVQGNHAFRITHGNCMGTLSNKSGSPTAVNQDTLAVMMNNYIINPCVLYRQWGFYETDKYVMELEFSGADGDAKDGGTATVVEENMELSGDRAKASHD